MHSIKYNTGVRNGLFVAFSIMGLGLFFGPLRELIGLSFHIALYSHVALIPLVSFYFMYLNRRAIFSDLAYSYQIGIPMVAAAALFYFIGKYYLGGLSQNDYLSFMMFGAVTWFAGSFVLCFGTHAFREGAFPLLFLIFMVPLPTLVLEPFIRLLLTGSAHAVHGILKLTGVPFMREGFVFSLAGIDVEVAKQCSGIRSSLALLITSIVAGRLFLRTGWRRILLALSVFPITMFKNGLRVVTLSLLAAYVDKTFITNSWLHSSGGIPFFVVALVFLAPVLWFLRKSEKKSTMKLKQNVVEMDGDSVIG